MRTLDRIDRWLHDRVPGWHKLEVVLTVAMVVAFILALYMALSR